jgi:hypothetical protein
MSLQKFDTIKRYFTFLAVSVILLLKCNFVFAQKDLEDSGKIYEYWSKRGVIEVVYAYMNDYIITVSDSALPKGKILNCTSEKNGLEEFERQFITSLETIEKEELSSKLDAVSSFLKNNNWVSAEKNVLQPLLINLKDGKKLDKDFFKILKPFSREQSINIPGYTNKMLNWNKTVIRIIKNYSDDLEKLPSPPTDGGGMPDPPGPSKDPGGVGYPSPVEPLVQNWRFALLIAFFSFLIGVSTTFFIIKSRIYYFFGDDKLPYKDRVQGSVIPFLSMISLLKKRKDYYKAESSALTEKIDQFKKELQSEKDNKSKNIIVVDVKDPSIVVPTDPYITTDGSEVKETGNISTLYFSIPENDGRFNIEKGEQTNDGSKNYKIVSKNSSDEGDLIYISSTRDKRAINRLDSYLKPVCDIDNISNAESASKIEVIKNGKVIKIAGNWVIDTNHKVKIKLV